MTDEIEVKTRKPRLFPIILLQDYMPAGDYEIEQGGIHELLGYIKTGSKVKLPIDEAKAAMANGVAERNDPVG